MVKIPFDLHFAVIATEGLIARRYTEVAVHRMQRLPEEVRSLILSQLEVSGCGSDEEARDIAYQEIYYLEDQLPRLESYGAVVVLYSSYESTLNRLPSFVLPHPVPSIRSAEGDSFLSKANNYYKNVLGVPLFESGAQETLLRTLADIRHCVAHASGYISTLEPKQQRRIQSAVRRYRGVEVADGLLTISPKFLRKVAGAVEGTLRALIKTLQREYREPAIFGHGLIQPVDTFRSAPKCAARVLRRR